MTSRKYVYAAAAAIVIAAVIYFASLPASVPVSQSAQTRELAPDFTLQTPDGRAVSLSDSRGKPVMLNFWASWCPFCVDEMPLLERVAKESNVELLFINLQESRESAVAFADKLNIESAILLDPDSEVKNKYNVFTQPVTYFIDANGFIVDKKFGPLTEQELMQKLNAFSASPSPADGETKTVNGEKYLASVNPAEIIGGGPPKDGIPSIDSPKFERAGEASWLNDDDLVLGLNANGAVKAYPHRILNWHEIVNDFAGNTPIAVTYCPLCRTGIAYERVLGGETVEFGTSGKLYKSDLVMYDRKTDTYWSQVLGQGIKGELAGVKLNVVPIDTVRWKDWKAAQPDTLVLSRDTGFPAYLAAGRYDVIDLYGTAREGFSGIGVRFTDNRLPSNAIVYGIVMNNISKAYEENSLKSVKLLNDELGGEKIVVVWNDALQTGQIFRSGGKTFTFSSGEIKDESGSVWTTGRMNAELERVNSFPHFWFAWAAFYPDTVLYK